jgi:hypothetical protein
MIIRFLFYFRDIAWMLIFDFIDFVSWSVHILHAQYYFTKPYFECLHLPDLISLLISCFIFLHSKTHRSCEIIYELAILSFLRFGHASLDSYWPSRHTISSIHHFYCTNLLLLTYQQDDRNGHFNYRSISQKELYSIPDSRFMLSG